jgi:ABC-type polysaccharide/polyol phosphate export permease
VVIANPLFHSITFARTLLINGHLFDPRQFAVLFLVNGLMLFASYRIFKRLEPTFSENV